MSNESHHREDDQSDQELSLQEAIDQIAVALKASRSPLFVGLENLSMEAQRAAMKLARIGRATVDSSCDNIGRGNLFALQKRGRVSATLGEIKSRSNLCVFWYCDPVSDHPNFFDEFINPHSQTVVVDSAPNATSQLATRHITLPPDQAVQSIWAMRASIANLNFTEAELPQEIFQLADQLPTSQYGAIFWGSAHQNAEFDLQADGIHSMIRELNQHTRFVGIPYRADANGLSAENVSTWISGFPFAVNWNRQNPRQHWLEYSDLNVSERDEWDFLLSFEIGEVTIACQSGDNHSAFQIALPVAPLGIEEAGSACRFDDVGIAIEATGKATSPTSLAIIEGIQQAVPCDL